MKKILIKISVALFALFFGIYSSLYYFCVPVYASALPDPGNVITDNFTVINGSGGSGSSTIDLSKYSNYSMEMALMSFAEGSEMDSIAATEQQVIQMVADFSAEYGDDAFRIAVAQPSEVIRKFFWDDPVNALGQVFDATDAGMVVLADNYVAFSDAFMGKLKGFLSEHIKNNVYYSDPSYNAHSMIYKFSNKNFYCQNLAYYKSSRTVNSFKRDYPFVIHSTTKDSNHVLCDVYNIYYYNLVTKEFVDYNIAALLNPSLSHDWNILCCNLPIFDIFPNMSNSDWWKEAKNFYDLSSKIVTPVNNPIPIECPAFYNIDECQPYIDACREGSKNNQKLPDEDPDKDPDGFPIIKPVPIEIPEPVPSPIEIPDIIPPPDDDPVPSPDDDPDPVPSPDDDPVPPPDDDPDPVPPPGDDPVPPPDDDPDPVPPPDDDPVPPSDDDPVPPDSQDKINLDIPDDSGGSPLMDLSNFFPFCLPMDLYLAFQMLKAEPKSPVFEIPVQFHLLNGEEYNHTFIIDIVQPAGEGSGSAEPYVIYFRWFLTFLFIIFLIFTSIKITPH